jgi:hypothetical protein
MLTLKNADFQRSIQRWPRPRQKSADGKFLRTTDKYLLLSVLLFPNAGKGQVAMAHSERFDRIVFAHYVLET